MKRLLQSPWVSSILGLVLFLATMIAVWRPRALPPEEPMLESKTRHNGPSWAFFNPEMDLLMSELKQQKEALAAKEKSLNELAERLRTERSELNQLTQVVQQAQTEFDQNVTRVREQETSNLKKLAKMYSTMSPEGAAAVFKAMDDASVVKVLTFMRETETAPVLEAMARQSEADAKRVAGISERLRLSIAEVKKAPAS